MPGLNFSAANLAVVAYAHVRDDGTSADTNSGVTSTRTAAGSYRVFLPGGITQDVNRNLVFVTPNEEPGIGGPQCKSVEVNKLSASIIEVFFFDDPSALIDSAFDILILRTTISPPLNAPA